MRESGTDAALLLLRMVSDKHHHVHCLLLRYVVCTYYCGTGEQLQLNACGTCSIVML